MSPQQIFALVLALSMLNGIFSPYLLLVVGLSPLWMPAWIGGDPRLLFYLSSMVTATTTLLLAGVPAALAEGAAPRLRGTSAAMWIWAGAATVLSLPGLLRAWLLFAGA